MKNTKHIFSRFFNAVGKSSTLSELAQYMAVFYFNMRTVHFNTNGKNFLELHNYAQDLYLQAELYYDDLIETALSFNETVQPMFVTPGSWIPVNSCPFNVEETINTINSSIRMLFDFLESVAKEVYPSFVYSKIDSMLEWLDKQNYKLQQMSKEI